MNKITLEIMWKLFVSLESKKTKQLLFLFVFAHRVATCSL